MTAAGDGAAEGGAAQGCRLYLITPPRIEPAAFAETLATALDAGDVACVQLRLPDAAREARIAAAEVLRPVCHARGVALLLDEDPEAARAAGLDGVHLSDPRALGPARESLGDGAIAGVACGGSRHAAMVAAEKGADYVSFGAFFPSPTLPDAALAEPEIIAWWSELMVVPCVAVGGVTPENCAPLVAAGADFLAVSSAVWGHPMGPAAAVAAFAEAIGRAAERPR